MPQKRQPFTVNAESHGERAGDATSRRVAPEHLPSASQVVFLRQHGLDARSLGSPVGTDMILTGAPGNVAAQPCRTISSLNGHEADQSRPATRLQSCHDGGFRVCELPRCILG